ncbi:MAG: CvpA family protein [Ferruginibacter sp.]
MNIIDVIVVFILLLIACIGYIQGFIRMAGFILKIAVAVSAAYVLCSALVDQLIHIFPSLDESLLPPFVLAGSFFIFFLIGTLLLLPVYNSFYRIEKALVNKIAGVIPAVFIALFAIGYVARVSAYLPVPEEIKKDINNNQIAALASEPAEWAEEKLYPFFIRPVTPLITVATENIIHENEMVRLSFSTNDFLTRKDMEMVMLQMINAERIRAGLSPLLADTAMAAVARSHSADMFRRGYFSHNTPEGIDPFKRMHAAGISYSIAGENLAMAPTVELAHRGLMKSPGHRANILNNLYGRVGIGILDADSNGLMITQEFRD